jgi:putative hemolysin
MKKRISLTLILIILLMGCTPAPVDQTQPEPAPVSTELNMPNPASAYCEQQGYRLEIRTVSDGGQTGFCIFPDGSECDEWAYFRGECGPVSNAQSPIEFPTALPINSADYDQGWWSFTHPVFGFTIMLPEGWVVEDVADDTLLNGHLLNLHPKDGTAKENVRLTFRRIGEDVLLWPTGVGQGEFIQQGALDIAGKPARRILLVCPTGEVTAIWYQSSEEGQPNITRGGIEFGFIYSISSHCDPGLSLNGKTQYMGEMIIASLKVP